MRHRELMGTIQGSAAGSAHAIVSATAVSELPAVAETPTAYSPSERVADADRERAIGQLDEHMMAGRHTAEEFEERVSSAHRVRTRADLDAVMIDLPRSSSTSA